MRASRAACTAEAAKLQLPVVDFVTYNRLDENNWDSTIRVRRKGNLVRIGCRYDVRANVSYIYEPSAADGGNPWGPAGPPKAVPAQTKPAARAEPRSEPVTKGAAPGATINLQTVADTTARTAIVRTRDACVAEAARRKIKFDDFDAFRRVEGPVWEAMLLVKKGTTATRSCRFDVNTGKATIR